MVRPAGVPDFPDHALARGGWCVARADGWLCWAGYRAGGRYWFEELRIPYRRLGIEVESYRVFAGADFGYAGREMFRAMFEECP